MSEVIVLPTEIGEGKAREVQTLFADSSRRLVLIRLRNNAVLADHTAKVPIMIQALLGKGTLNIAGQDYALTPGVIIPVDAHAVHHVRPNPAVAILVTFFRQPDVENETTAQFD